jgi:hypothetical protein
MPQAGVLKKSGGMMEAPIGMPMRSPFKAFNALQGPCIVGAPKKEAFSPAPRQNVDHDPKTEERLVLCPQCQLPLGEQGYLDEEQETLMHAECKAQLLLKDARRENEVRLKRDAATKKERRAEYSLGWKASQIPRNEKHCENLQGLCALIWDEESKSAQVMTTEDPATSLNVEYLALALQVRRQEGREPVFSLDPLDDASAPQDKRDAWQTKRFEPAWLAGTGVGEVLFQADFYLKELSMGEHVQPVVGMKSALEFSQEEKTEGRGKEWSAREWFVIRKAELLLGEDNVLMPGVEMAVEAREQVFGADGKYEDVPITRGDHPCVKYADDFSHYIDLIAERKSVVFHLRELAKCTVLAKFLTEQESNMEDYWLSIAAAAVENPGTCCMKVPQVWNEKGFSNIQVTDGKIDDSVTSLTTKLHGVYGGVELGLPQARVRAAKPAHLTAKMISVGGQVPEVGIQPRVAMGAIGAAPMSFVGGIRAPSAIIGAPAMLSAAGVRPQGVDLNLNSFDLSTAALAADVPVGSWQGRGFQGRSFWPSLAKMEESVAEDQHLLRAIFSSKLCDRREEGDLFVPPDARLKHVERLRALLAEEDVVRKQREEHFFSMGFLPLAPGPHFPSTWSPAQGITSNGRAATAQQQGALQPRPDYLSEGNRLVKSAVPTFDKATEDGTHFRIYQVGTLEIRTTQAHDGDEVTGAVFSISALPKAASTPDACRTVARTDKVVKALEYVEHAGMNRSEIQYFVVLETESGDAIVTEKRLDGKAAWVENPEGLEARRSLGRVVRAADWSDREITVGDMKTYQGEELQMNNGRAKRECKNFADGVFLRA